MTTHTVTNLHDATVENSTPIIFRMDGGNAWLFRGYLLEVYTWKLEGERLSLYVCTAERKRDTSYTHAYTRP